MSLAPSKGPVFNVWIRGQRLLVVALTSHGSGKIGSGNSFNGQQGIPIPDQYYGENLFLVSINIIPDQ